jgi:hypothetical protein
MELLKEIHLASLTFIAVIVCTVIAFATREINYLEAVAALGAGGIGSGAIGIARNGAGHGVS